MGKLNIWKKKLWFYKEYIVVGAISIVLLTWVIMALGFVSSPTHTLSTSKLPQTQKTEFKNIPKIQINLPRTEHLLLGINDSGNIVKEDFIKQYKTTLKNLNDIKGKFNLNFYFYKHDNKLSQVKVSLQFSNKEGLEWSGEQNLTLKENE